MDLFVWDRSFSTGMSDLDEQHQGLINTFNELHTSLFGAPLPPEQREAVLRRSVDRLMAYARTQFSAEEAWMQAHGLDERHVFVHRRQHEQFIRNLRELWSERETVAELPARMMGFLSSWIGLHVLGVDPAMVRQLHQVQAGISPADAYEREASVSDKGLRALLNMVGRLYQDLSMQTVALGQARQGQAQAENQVLMISNRLEVHARYDELLQVANQRYFDQRLHEEVARAYRGETALAVMLVALDRLTDAPQRLDASDACMQAAAQALTQSMKRTTDLVARHGTHQLAVMMPDTDGQGASRAALRVVKAIADLGWVHPDLPDGQVVTASVGLAARVPRSRDDGHALVAQAAQALAQARQQGGNGMVLRT